ncbi:tetratricopeptide repeat protein [Puteibacter caeruleilacunae]|nr:tetratricopeptide repeat protein [Puteibacter caeruleilacunae]
MTKDKKHSTHADGMLEVENALTKSEQFIEENQKILSIVVGSIVAIVAIYLGYNKFYVQPLEEEAKSEMYIAEQYFEKDSFNLAVNGDGNYGGFLDIIDNYGSTPSGELAKYYAGISYLHMGQYDDALDYLKSFSTDDLNLSAVATGAQGDAYLEKGDKDKAVAQYKKAAAIENDFTAPIYLLKLGQLYEAMGDKAKALDTYKSIKADYPKSSEGNNVDKFIARISMEK